MNANDLVPFDPEIIPWSTHVNDWGLCLTVDPEGRVWVEYDLIRVILNVKHLNNNDIKNIHSVLTTVGGKVARVLDRHPGLLGDGQIRAMKFTDTSIDIRMGRFGGEVFVFLPRSEFEQGYNPSNFFNPESER